MWKMHEIREMIKLFEESALEEMKVELEGSESNIFLKKQAGATIQLSNETIETVKPSMKQEPVAVAVKEAPASMKKETVKPVQEERLKPVNADDSSLKKVVSPMVGTFYNASSPESHPFVRIGDKVESSTVVCILEAMKLFNEIEAEVSGEIVDILVENGHLVEHGQTLFLVKPE
ncbi:acetyl-CoA carboxylase biotin carboxyl carrier protein [Neobacillus vireti]|uniref:acetyl-CoA carboxylase biotin carboxyl carrier protein n=1 Tax=Neobacillus vireti TaxID=220686 RepID=UPI002FFE8E92